MQERPGEDSVRATGGLSMLLTFGEEGEGQEETQAINQSLTSISTD
jgi:hypothetical protein